MLALSILFSDAAFSQSDADSVPPTLIIQGNGIQSTAPNGIILVACAEKNEMGEVVGCRRVRLVQVKEGTIPSWYGKEFYFQSLNIAYAELTQDRKTKRELEKHLQYHPFSGTQKKVLRDIEAWKWNGMVQSFPDAHFQRYLSLILAHAQNDPAPQANTSSSERLLPPYFIQNEDRFANAWVNDDLTISILAAQSQELYIAMKKTGQIEDAFGRDETRVDPKHLDALCNSFGMARALQSRMVSHYHFGDHLGLKEKLTYANTIDQNGKFLKKIHLDYSQFIVEVITCQPKSLQATPISNRFKIKEENNGVDTLTDLRFKIAGEEREIAITSELDGVCKLFGYHHAIAFSKRDALHGHPEVPYATYSVELDQNSKIRATPFASDVPVLTSLQCAKGSP